MLLTKRPLALQNAPAAVLPGLLNARPMLDDVICRLGSGHYCWCRVRHCPRPTGSCWCRHDWSYRCRSSCRCPSSSRRAGRLMKRPVPHFPRKFDSRVLPVALYLKLPTLQRATAPGSECDQGASRLEMPSLSRARPDFVGVAPAMFKICNFKAADQRYHA
jgi:hypothetical protein